jgi:hypothetical protein
MGFEMPSVHAERYAEDRLVIGCAHSMGEDGGRMSEKSGSSSRQFGEGMQETLAKRGIHLTLEEAASFSRALLDLAEHGLLVPVEKPEERPTQIREG